MGKMDYYLAGRNDGLALALEIAKEGGAEALEEELRFRKITGINTALAKKDINKAANQLKDRVTATLCLASLKVLRDKFGFGEVRARRYADEMAVICQSVLKDVTDWTEISNEIKENLNYEVWEWWKDVSM